MKIKNWRLEDMSKFKYVCLLALSVFSVCLAKDHTVVLIQFDEYDTNDAFFAGGPGNFWYELRKSLAGHGYHLTTRRDACREPYALIAFNAPRSFSVGHYAGPRTKKILYTWEPPAIQPPYNYSKKTHDQFDIVMTWHDGLIDDKKYRKYNYALHFEVPKLLIAFDQKKLCTMFAGNKQSRHTDQLYSKRLELIQFFEKYAPEDFDLYGTGWPLQRKSYRGWVEDKILYMRHYKFAIAYENSTNVPGYISEKIFDAFSAGCVPIYWGASNVMDHIPAHCFIDRRQFANDVDLYVFLKNMTEELYNEYLNNIRMFLQSEKAQLFSCQHFIDTLLDVLDSFDQEIDRC